MRLIDQSCTIVKVDVSPLEHIELCGRTCYKSEDKITDKSSGPFVSMLLSIGHESVIEHCSMTVRFITNRGVTHELVRHRLAAFSQESTRYVNYGSKPIEFIRPVWFTSSSEEVHDPGMDITEQEGIFLISCCLAEEGYLKLLECGWRPEQAREVLTNSLKTEIVMTANFREWRHVFRLRTSPKAHPQMRALMLDCLSQARERVPVIFDNI